MQRTDFATRARGLAQEIEAARPDLIALQEAAAWRTRGDNGAPTVEDHLAVPEAELAARGARYRRVVTAEVGDVELPSAAGFNVGLTNRLAILARSDAAAACMSRAAAASPACCRSRRRWASSGSRAAGSRSTSSTTAPRCASSRTHLEVASTRAGGEAQLAQADELLRGPAACAHPVVMAGDFNAWPARPGMSAYVPPDSPTPGRRSTRSRRKGSRAVTGCRSTTPQTGCGREST